MSTNRRFRLLSRVYHSLLITVMLATFAAKVNASGALVFQDNFTGPLNHSVWNPFITAEAGGAWPWNMQNSQGVPSSAIDKPNNYNADYDLPSLVRTGHGLQLTCTKGSSATGYTWSGSVICSYPNDHYFKTTGFTFSSGYVEIRAKMPLGLDSGSWPGIWFLPGPGSHGGEIDLMEGGFIDKAVNPAHLMATTLHYTDGTSSQVLTDTGEDLSGGYHTYALAYKSGVFIKAYLDGVLKAQWTKNVFTGSYYIILSNTRASSPTTGWHSQFDSTTPTTESMDVQYVRVHALKD